MERCLSMEGSGETGQVHRPFQVFIVHPCDKLRNGMCRLISVILTIVIFIDFLIIDDVVSNVTLLMLYL